MDLEKLYPKYRCPKCEDWFHMPWKFCRCAIHNIEPGDYGRMDWDDIAQAINATLERNGLPHPAIGECNRTAMKKILSALLTLEARAK